VIETGSDGGAGNYVSIYDPAAKRTYNYLHMLAPALVDGGERVRAGQKLGELGCTGSCWGNHLHFEVRVGRGTWGAVLDPMPTLRRLSAEMAFAGRLRAD
jgi:murein DD-endopeptidase MepM/ murein hydrolase activator NlpD